MSRVQFVKFFICKTASRKVNEKKEEWERLKYLTLKQLTCACDGAKEVNADCVELL
jgi:hypothetical protein